MMFTPSFVSVFIYFMHYCNCITAQEVDFSRHEPSSTPSHRPNWNYPIRTTKPTRRANYWPSCNPLHRYERPTSPPSKYDCDDCPPAIVPTCPPESSPSKKSPPSKKIPPSKSQPSKDGPTTSEDETQSSDCTNDCPPESFPSKKSPPSKGHPSKDGPTYNEDDTKSADTTDDTYSSNTNTNTKKGKPKPRHTMMRGGSDSNGMERDKFPKFPVGRINQEGDENFM